MVDPIVTPPHPPVSVPQPLSPTVDFNPPMVGTATPFERVDGQNRDLVLEAIRAWARGPLFQWADAWQADLIEWLNDTENWLDSWNAEVVRYVQDVLASVINSSIELQDPVMSGIINTDSLTRMLLDTLYSPKNAIFVQDFGAVGDGVADDTAALQAAIDAAILEKKSLRITEGTYSSGPLNFNGSTYNPVGTPTTQAPAVRNVIGDGRDLTIIKARPGKFGPTDWLVKHLNTAGSTFQGLTLEGDGLVWGVADFSWKGTSGAAAPSNGNTYHELIIQGGIEYGVDFNQQHDSELSSILVRRITNGATSANARAIRFVGNGGMMNMANITAYSAVVEIGAQNGRIDACVFMGILLAAGGRNSLHFSGSHIYPSPRTNITIQNLNTSVGVAGPVFDGCYFPYGEIANATLLFGNWFTGAVFNGCTISPAIIVGDMLPNSGMMVLFEFNHSLFLGGNPLNDPNKRYRISTVNCGVQGVGRTENAWESWTVTNPTIFGTGATVKSRFKKNGSTVEMALEIVLGANPAIPATWTVNAPVLAQQVSVGSARFTDAGVKEYAGLVSIADSALTFMFNTASGGTAVGTSIPFAWGAGDTLRANLTYEAKETVA